MCLSHSVTLLDSVCCSWKDKLNGNESDMNILADKLVTLLHRDVETAAGSLVSCMKALSTAVKAIAPLLIYTGTDEPAEGVKAWLLDATEVDMGKLVLGHGGFNAIHHIQQATQDAIHHKKLMLEDSKISSLLIVPVLDNIIKNSERCASAGAEMLLGAAHATLRVSVTALESIAGGNKDGKAWDADDYVKHNAPWDEYLKAVETKLLNDETSGSIPAARENAMKDRADMALRLKLPYNKIKALRTLKRPYNKALRR